MTNHSLRIRRLACLAVLGFFSAGITFATVTEGQTNISSLLEIGGNKFAGWSGFASTSQGVASLAMPGEAIFVYPNGPRGQFKHGFRVLNDSAAEWQKFYGVQFEVNLPNAREVELTASILRIQRTASPETPVSGTMRVIGKGWHTITMPWSAFDFEQANYGFLKYVKEFKVAAKAADGKPGKIQLRNLRVVKAPAVALEADVRGRSAAVSRASGISRSSMNSSNASLTSPPAAAGLADTAALRGVEYGVQVGNCSNVKQSVALSFVKYGWEEMASSVEPSSLQLAPGESRVVKVRVKISDRVPPGGHETQVLQAIANGDAATASKLKFITTSEVPSPFILHTPARWQEVRERIAKYPWAKEKADEFIKKAADWRVPEVASPDKAPDDTYGPYVFATQTENDLMACGCAWQLTGDKKFAEKIALYLRRLSNATNGYPATLRACNQSLVQEGHFFQHVAMAYDMALDSGVFSEGDQGQIETTFRAFMETIERACDYGPINNWNVSEVCGAFYCSLVMGDLAEAEHWFSGPSGICDQLSKGVMDDGWWNECSIGYNTWVASEFTQVALAYEPFGINFRDMKVPASFSPRVMLSSELSGGVAVGGTAEERRKPFGMESNIYGPNRKPYRNITMMWDSLLPFLDYRSVMFGVNDSAESLIGGTRTEIGGSPFELAYYVYRDPAYAAVIKSGNGKRDLLYGVPDLPEQTPERFRDSAFADNVGLVMLRSQTTNRPVREQIQAALHYGTHGWAHGHFDRTGLLSLMRYGRSFFNPEMVWFGYEPFMYKFYVQTSVAKNMVVVDQKMQEASPGNHLLFHSGTAMQATVVETTTRWGNPPYGGMVYDYVPVKTFEQKTWREGRYVPIPIPPGGTPAYGSLTDFSEKILQRRAMIVTDDYVVLADYVKGTNAHTFESLFQMKGFQGLEAPEKKFLRYDAQWNPDPLGSAQFVTDCDWFEVAAPAKSRFEMRFGPGADNAGTRALYSEDGVLKLDIHTLWPPKQEIMVGTTPEDHAVEKRLFYTVRGDGKTLAEGKFGAWILGSADIDVPLDGVKQLELETRTELSKKPTLFWASARIVTKDGKEISLSELPVKFENVEEPKEQGKDYFGGPIKILGNEYKSAAPGQPKNDKQPGFVRVDLSGVNAVRFKATLGSDYPLGDEAQRRKTYAVRAADGDEARFLTVIEPYEDKPFVKSAVALSADKLRVELTDGRVQEISIHNLDGDGKSISAEITETRDGAVTRSESTSSSQAHD
jgi:hypothetical protein